MLAWAYGLTHAHSFLLLKLEHVPGRIKARPTTEDAKHPLKRVLVMYVSFLSADSSIAEFSPTQGGFTLNSVLRCLQIPELKFLPFFSLSVLSVL